MELLQTGQTFVYVKPEEARAAQQLFTRAGIALTVQSILREQRRP